MSDPAEDVPTDRQFRESNRDFELGALRLGMTRAVGIRTVVELTDQLHRSIQGMEVAIPMIADVHHASTGRRSQVGTRKNRGFERSDIRKTGVLLLSMITKAACFPGFQGVNAYANGEEGLR